ncbi:hypothetical protein Egran_05194 [Elaphomyces granulatus]|uniref:Spindle pole body component n=1 Tax=Elaphomyces granulatus TaxID=519963 RepID=A0A232LSN4_9EURO|nr:hypothetical protein Egran_05194 [Elaphomyces granulatus]
MALATDTSTLFKTFRSRAGASLKKNASRGADHFSVKRQLDGLQEKFRVLNNDDLADALSTRLDELEQWRRPWEPEILSLLLQLSDRPATLSKVDSIQLRPVDSFPTLVWSGFDASGTAYCQDDIWQDIDFAAESSNDDLSVVSSDISIPRIVPQRSQVPKDEINVSEDLFSSGEDEALIVSIKNGQFWKEDCVGNHGNQTDHSRFITELQAIREFIFMLRGLPTALFWHLDDGIEIDRRYALVHSSNQAFLNMLRKVCSIGKKVKVLRQFIQNPQSIIFMQTFLRGIEDCVFAFDSFLSKMQSQYLLHDRAAAVSMLQLLEDVRRESKLLILLSDLVSKLTASTSDESFKCLDLLYDLVCLSHASGDDDIFRYLAKFFFACFEAYIRPVRLWMETGQLDSTQGTFFISDTRQSSDLRNLWHDWYTLDDSSGNLNVPKFLKPAAHKIFTTGKNMIFLRNMNVPAGNLSLLGKASLNFCDICPDEPSSLLLPFSGLLEAAFDKLIDANHALTSRILREQLDEQCGLWTSLQALEYIYLGRDITISSTIDNKIFDLIDKGHGVWNDRFLLTELVQAAFSQLPCVDSSRLIVRSFRVSNRDAENGGRSVKILKALLIDYILPWPVANIITKYAIQTHQRIATFLMQIRRAKHGLERQRLRKNDFDVGIDDEEDVLGYGIRHCLLWFINILYSHLTELVISMATVSMQRALSGAKDIDSMIAAHRAYMTSLEDQCLLSKHLAPIYQAIVGLLDLCIHFADIQAARHGENQFDQTTRSFGSSTGHKYTLARKSRHRHRQINHARSISHFDDYDQSDDVFDDVNADDDDDDDDEEEEGYGDEYAYDDGNATSISFLESPYSHRLRNLKSQFDRLVVFIAAGLRAVGRVDGQQSWEMLAERLEWKRDRFVMA